MPAARGNGQASGWLATGQYSSGLVFCRPAVRLSCCFVMVRWGALQKPATLDAYVQATPRGAGLQTAQRSAHDNNRCGNHGHMPASRTVHVCLGELEFETFRFVLLLFCYFNYLLTVTYHAGCNIVCALFTKHPTAVTVIKGSWTHINCAITVYTNVACTKECDVHQ